MGVVSFGVRVQDGLWDGGEGALGWMAIVRDRWGWFRIDVDRDGLG